MGQHSSPGVPTWYLWALKCPLTSFLVPSKFLESGWGHVGHLPSRTSNWPPEIQSPWQIKKHCFNASCHHSAGFILWCSSFPNVFLKLPLSLHYSCFHCVVAPPPIAAVLGLALPPGAATCGFNHYAVSKFQRCPRAQKAWSACSSKCAIEPLQKASFPFFCQNLELVRM